MGTEAAITTMISACEEIALRNLTLWKKDNDGKSLVPPGEIRENICPNGCSGHGKCLYARCVCDNDYISADCSLKKGL